MELRQLEYFVAVAEEGSFTRAAERLHVAQPGVSAQVRRLEAELGEALLDRSGRTVRPTDVGAAVLPHARAALEAVAAVRRAVEERTGLLGGHVAVGIVGAGPAPCLPDLLAGFHRAHPAVRLTLDRVPRGPAGGPRSSPASSTSPSSPRSTRRRPGWRPTSSPTSRSSPRSPATTRSPGRATIGLADLGGHELIGLPPGAGLRTGLDTARARAGARPRIALEANDPPCSPSSPPAASAWRSCRSRSPGPGPRRRTPSPYGPRCAAGSSSRGRAGPWSPAARALIADARAILPP